MDGCTRQNPAYRPAKGRAPSRGLFLCVGAIASIGLIVPPGPGAASIGPALAEAAPADEWRPDVKRARKYAKQRTGDVRFAVRDPRGKWRDFHGGRTSPMASTIKVMLLAAYLRRPSVRDRSLRGDERNLLGPMIRRSDNDAATRVRDIVGKNAIQRVARDGRMHRFRYSSIWGLSRASARDGASLMSRFEKVVPRRHEGYAKHLLASIVLSQRWGVARARPRGWKLFFKGGWGVGTGNVNHQIAFLQRHGTRVALAIHTEFSRSHAYGKKTLEGVASRLLRGLRRRGSRGVRTRVAKSPFVRIARPSAESPPHIAGIGGPTSLGRIAG
jgi:hypothetical protein